MSSKKQFYYIVNFIIRIILAVVVFLLFLHSIFSTSFMGWVDKEDGSLQSRTLNIADSPWKHLLILLLITFILVLFRTISAKRRTDIKEEVGIIGKDERVPSYENRKKYVGMVGIIAFVGIVAAAVWILVTRFLPGSDPSKVCNVASQWMAGDFSAFDEGQYLFCYPFQSGIVLFYYLLSKVFGDGNYVAMQFVNLAALTAFYYLLFKIFSRFWKWEKKVLLISYLALILWAPLMFYVTYLYGILPGMACSIGAAYLAVCYLETRKWWYMFPAALLMGIATVLKMNCLIYLIAIGCFLVYDAIDILFISKQKGKKWIVSLAFVAAMGLGVYGCNQATNAYVEHLSGYEMPEGEVMLSWVVMGLSEAPNAPGNYNGYIGNVFFDNHFDTELATEQSKADLKNIIKRMIKSPIDSGVTFFARKTAYQWNDPTFIAMERMEGRKSTIAVSAQVRSLIEGKGRVILSVILNTVQTVILTGMLFYLLFTRKSSNLNELLVAVVFLGGFLFHMVWESSPSYTFPYFVLLIPYAVKGFAEYGRWAEQAYRWVAESSAEQKKQDMKKWFSKKNTPVIGAVAVILVLLILFAQTNLFDRTIALDDGADAWRQFYQMQDNISE
ncbi:MAG: hypothetical protein J6K48_08345 [Lachnospiraceae bacterium]|nr:hypothetical protein [Lachnospiraceae bacterium]